MARHESDFIAQRKEPLADRGNELVVVAAGKIRAPDGALKEHISHKRDFRGLMDEDDMAGRVAGAVAHAQRIAGNIHRVFVL